MNEFNVAVTGGGKPRSMTLNMMPLGWRKYSRVSVDCSQGICTQVFPHYGKKKKRELF